MHSDDNMEGEECAQVVTVIETKFGWNATMLGLFSLPMKYCELGSTGLGCESSYAITSRCLVPLSKRRGPNSAVYFVHDILHMAKLVLLVHHCNFLVARGFLEPRESPSQPHSGRQIRAHSLVNHPLDAVAALLQRLHRRTVREPHHVMARTVKQVPALRWVQVEEDARHDNHLLL